MSEDEIEKLMADHDYCVTERATIAFARAIELQAFKRVLKIANKLELQAYHPEAQYVLDHLSDAIRALMQDASSEKEQNNG